MSLTDRQRVSMTDAIRRSKPSNSRMVRMVSTPVKNAAIAAMRATGRERLVSCPVIWGDKFWGTIPEAVTSLVWRFGFYESTTSIFLMKYLNDGASLLDVGAHFGYFSMLGSRLVGPTGRVLSIEAMPRTYAALQNNIAKNGLQNVVALNIAAADADGILHFQDFGIVNSSLNTMFRPRGALQDDNRAGIDVTVIGKRLDPVIAEQLGGRVDVMKIDAESSEENVLRGLVETIATSRPIVIIELGGGDSEEDARAKRIADTMAATGHRAFAFDGAVLHEVRSFDRLPYVNAFFLTDDHISNMAVGSYFDEHEGYV
jgi:FkbM family methyltransferase